MTGHRLAHTVIRPLVVLGVTAWLMWFGPRAAAQEVRFFDDDPLTVDRDTEDASGVVTREVDLLYEFIESLFMDPGGPRRPGPQRQHHRRGPGLQLVHQPHRDAQPVTPRDRYRPGTGRGPPTGCLEGRARQDRGHHARLAGPGRGG